MAGHPANGNIPDWSTARETGKVTGSLACRHQRVQLEVQVPEQLVRNTTPIQPGDVPTHKTTTVPANTAEGLLALGYRPAGLE